MEDAPTRHPGPPPIAPDRLNALRDRLRRDVDAGLIPGATVAVGRSDGMLFEATVGFRDPVAREALKPDAIWRIYSMTKPLVTAVAMMLVEQGALCLDQPVADLLPGFAGQRVATPDGGWPAKSVATIQDLMRHTAGIAYAWGDDSPAQRALAADGFATEDLPLWEFVERLTALPLEHEPGTVWHYSHATEVLGRIVEVVGGGALGEVLRTMLLDPLGMTETGFALPERDRGRVAQPLPQQPGARPSFFDPCAPRRHQSAGGGLVSTVRDYARFLRMLLGRGTLDGRRILSPAAVALMTADHLGAAIRPVGPYPLGPGYGFGLGFAVRTAAGVAPFPGSVGDYYWSGVGGTYFWVDPTLDFFAILMLQSSSLVQRQHYRTLARAMVYAAIG